MIKLLTDIPDYNDELERLADNSESSDFIGFIDGLFDTSFDLHLGQEFYIVLKYISIIVILVVLFWFIYKEFILPSRFIEYETKKNPVIPMGGLRGTAADADIRGHNFEKELRQALSASDYAEAVRLRYLYTLQQLHTLGVIRWTEWKTPLLYVDELDDDAELLKQLTNTFLYIKYGHYPAGAETYGQASELSETLIENAKGGKS